MNSEKESLDLQDDEECFYRGRVESAWDLSPTLLRHCQKVGVKGADSIRDLEANLYFEFRAKARELHDHASDKWDILFSMRHHGVATRLLDWTETLGVAVYFALRNASRGSRPCVWILNPFALNERNWGIRDLVAPEYLPQGDYSFSEYLVDYSEDAGFDWVEPVALYPIRRDSRLHAQRGYFTIHGEDIRPLDEIVPSLLRKVALPEEAWDDARLFLKNAGIDEFLLFPGLDALARQLNQRFEIT